MAERIVRITSRDLIRGVSNAWDQQYPGGREPVTSALRSIDAETATAEDVEAIIGNTSWTRRYCNVCEQEQQVIVRLGDEPDWESATLQVCEPCLVAALEVIRAGGAEGDTA